MPAGLTKKILGTGFAMILSCLVLFPQQDGTGKFLSAEQLADTLQKRYQISIFYKSGWLGDKTFDPSILKLPFEEMIRRVEAVAGMSLVSPDSVSYIFIPVSPVMAPQGEQEVSGPVVVGDKNSSSKNAVSVLSGKILNGISGAPLSGAYIIAGKQNFGAHSDDKGNYSIEAKPGDYTLRISFLGFEEQVVKIRLTGSGSLDFKLYEKAVRLPEVRIPSDRAGSDAAGISTGMIKLGLKDIRELPVSLAGIDIIKSLTMRPGVQTVGEFGSGFNVRGGSADQNLILLEDVPLFNSSHLFGLISAVSSVGISDVRLLKAGIPANYGERASSVMDIRMGTGEADKTKVTGDIGLINSSLCLETPLPGKHASLLIGARGSYTNWLLHSIDNIDLMNSSAYFYDANAMISLNPGSRDKLTIFGYISFDRFAHAGSNNAGAGINTDYQYMNLLGSVRWKHTFRDNLTFDAVAGISNYRFRVSESDTSRQWEAYRINSSILYRNARWNFSWRPAGNHRIDFGIAGILYDINPGRLAGLYQESVIRKVQLNPERAVESAVYITDKLEVNSLISVELGMRYTLYCLLGPSKVNVYETGVSRTPGSITDSVMYGRNRPVCSYSGLEPRLSVRFLISSGKSLKISYNRIHQYVNLISNTAVPAPTDVWKLSSPGLRPLTSDQVAAGFYWDINDGAFETSAELYYKKLTNGIDYKNGTQILLNPYLEADLVNLKGRNYGLELNVKKNSGRLTGWAGLTLARSVEQTKGRFPEDRINNDHPFSSDSDRPVSLVINANYHSSRRWRFGGTLNYSTGRPVTLPELKFDHQGYQVVYFSNRNKYRLPDYHRLDLSLTLDESLVLRKKIKGRWTLSVINVYGRKNAYSVFYRKEADSVSSGESSYGTYMLYIIGRPFPTLTYNFSF